MWFDTTTLETLPFSCQNSYCCNSLNGFLGLRILHSQLLSKQCKKLAALPWVVSKGGRVSFPFVGLQGTLCPTLSGPLKFQDIYLDQGLDLRLFFIDSDHTHLVSFFPSWHVAEARGCRGTFCAATFCTEIQIMRIFNFNNWNCAYFLIQRNKIRAFSRIKIPTRFHHNFNLFLHACSRIFFPQNPSFFFHGQGDNHHNLFSSSTFPNYAFLFQLVYLFLSFLCWSSFFLIKFVGSYKLAVV